MVAKKGVSVVVLMSWKFMFREFRANFAGDWSLVNGELSGGCGGEEIFEVRCTPFGDTVRHVVAGEIGMSFDPRE